MGSVVEQAKSLVEREGLSMSLRLQAPRFIPGEITVWGAGRLPLDYPYRQIGDTLYVELYAEYAADLAAVPAPAGLMPWI